mmetsp:Transcript_35570/g.43555  ORF Transcript_35570/g.43555 Transcript_35570/m.43555 type:complete len:201 (+) Transcript_35570:1250-1852(+)
MVISKTNSPLLTAMITHHLWGEWEALRTVRIKPIRDLFVMSMAFLLSDVGVRVVSTGTDDFTFVEWSAVFDVSISNGQMMKTVPSLARSRIKGMRNANLKHQLKWHRHRLRRNRPIGNMDHAIKCKLNYGSCSAFPVRLGHRHCNLNCVSFCRQAIRYPRRDPVRLPVKRIQQKNYIVTKRKPLGGLHHLLYQACEMIKP